MHLVAILAAPAATAVCGAAASLSLFGQVGWRNGWLDLINNFSPYILLAALCGGVMAWLSLEPGFTQTASLILALFAALCNIKLIVPELMRLRPVQSGGGRPLRILSANVWARNPSPELAVAEILARDADIVFLQESDGSLSPYLARLKSRYPYASECPRAGVQIFVKTPILDQGWGLGLGSIANRNTVWADTTLPDGRRVTVVAVHFVQPIPPEPQAVMREALALRLQSLPGNETMLLAGDFNTTPWSFAMRRQDELLRPLSRRTIALFSWPARLAGWRQSWPCPILPIDHFYAGSAWGKARVTRLRISGSDHFAIEAAVWPRQTEVSLAVARPPASGFGGVIAAAVGVGSEPTDLAAAAFIGTERCFSARYCFP